MTDEEILKEAIRVALEYDGKLYNPRYGVEELVKDLDYDNITDFKVYAPIIFSHTFNKAFHRFSGRNARSCPECNWESDYRDGWMSNLEEMVLEENPIKYLERFLNG